MGFLQYLPGILDYAVTSIFSLEKSLPQGGFGPTKKEILLTGVQTLLKATANETGLLAQAGSNVGTNTEINSIVSLTSGFVDATVARLKQSGAFKSATPAPALTGAIGSVAQVVAQKAQAQT